MDSFHMGTMLHEWIVHFDPAAADRPIGLSSSTANLTCRQISGFDHKDCPRADHNMINLRITGA